MESTVWESPQLKQLKTVLRETSLIGQASGLLGWDQKVYMPSGGAAQRGEVMAYLRKLMHERMTSPEVGRLLDELEPMVADLNPDSDAAALVRLVRRGYDQNVKVPAELVAEMSASTAEAYGAWVQARAEDNFALFQDHLARQIDYARKIGELLGYEDHPYDANLDRFEHGLKTKDVERLFARLRERLVPLFRRISERADAVDDSMLRQHYPADQQLALAEAGLRTIGFDFERGRQDLTVHPFCLGLSASDVRLTTRVEEDWLSNCFFSALHEGGHGLYEQGLPQEFANLPLATSVSLGIHETQSRLWENIIGRSRGFWEHFLPIAKEHFPAQLADVTVEQMYRAVNKSQASFIRTEADEVTYNLHVMLRFDLEKDLIAGNIAVNDLPELWNAKMQEYLGVTPPNDTLGVLQDVHWSSSYIGYFPTYTIGTVASVQLYNAAVAANPDIPAAIARGDLSGVLAWMREHVHNPGSRYTPSELLERATGSTLDAEPYLAYMEQKFTDIYGL